MNPFHGWRFSKLSYLGDAGILVGIVAHNLPQLLCGLLLALPLPQKPCPPDATMAGKDDGASCAPGASGPSRWEDVFHAVMLIIGVWGLIGFMFPVAREWLEHFGSLAVNSIGFVIVAMLALAFSFGALGILFSLRSVLFLIFRLF